MIEQPTLKTERLHLRPLAAGDAPRVRQLAGAWELASTTLNIPHPYAEGVAEAWIANTRLAFEAGEATTFAIVRLSDELLVGAISIRLSAAHRFGEIGYWIGVPYWGRGYCTEAAWAVLAYGFVELELNRIQARHMTRNLASGRVMRKIGMTYEGTLRQAVFRWGKYEDIAMYAILRQEFSPD